MESEDDDYQLQLALALSMQGDDAVPEQQALAPAPVPAPPAAHPAAPANGGGQPTPPADLAAALAAAFQAIAGGQPPPAANAPQQQQHQQEVQPPPAFFYQPAPQQQQQQRQQAPPPRVAAPSSSKPTPRKLPRWAYQLGLWWQPGSAAAAAGGAAGAASSLSAAGAAVGPDVQQLLVKPEVTVPLSELPDALAAMGVMLKQTVICPAAGGAAAAGGTGVLRLTCLVPSGSSSGTIRAADCDSLIGTWLSRAAATAGSPTQLALLSLAFQRTPAPTDVPEGSGGQLVLLLGLRLAARAVKTLEDDDDDLFYETGRSTQELLRALHSSTAPVPAPFLSAMLCCCTTAGAAVAWSRVLAGVIKGFAGYKLTGGVTELEPLLLGLDRVTQDPVLLRQLAHSLAAEVLTLPPASAPAALASSAAQGHAQSSILAPLLHVSSAVDTQKVLQSGAGFFGGGSSSSGGGGARVSAAAAAMSPASGLFTCLRSYPSNVGEVEGAKRLLVGILGRVVEVMHQLAKRLAGLKGAGVPPGAGREVLLGWLAAVAAANEVRCKGGEYSALRHLLGAPDGFMLNLTAAVLRLTKPFVTGYLTQNPKFGDLFTRHLSPSYYTTHGHRLGSAPSEASLSGEKGNIPSRPAAAAAAAAAGGPGSSSSSSGAAEGYVMAPDPAPAAASASFIAEVFFISQRYFRVGLLPAVHRYTKLYQHLWERATDAAQAAAAAGGAPPGRQAPPPELNLVVDCSVAQLLQPDMTADAVQFAVLEIVWLADILTSHQQQQQQNGSGAGSSSSSSSSLLACVPESVLADAAAWLTFVIQQGQSEQLAAVPIGLLMRSLVVLLENPSEVRSLLVVAKLVQLLLVMLAPQVNLERRTRGALGRSNLSPGETALVASVLGTSVTQQQLVPALMRVYGAADFVVGLDVDRDEYDKFTMRHQIDQIIEELWRDERCRACIRQQAAAPAAPPPAAAAAAAPAAAVGGGGGTPGLFAQFVSSVLNDLMYLFKDSLERLADIKQIEDSKADAAAWSGLPDSVRVDKENFYRGQQRTAGGFMSLARTTLELLITLTRDADIARTFMVQPLLGRTAFAVLHFLELLVGPRCQALDVANPGRYNYDKHALLLSMVQLAGQLARYPEFTQALAEEPDYEDAVIKTAVDLLNASHAYGPADMLAALLANVAKTPVHQKKRQRRGLAGFGTGSDTAAAAAADGANAPADAAAGDGSSAAAAAGDREAEIQGLVAAWSKGLGAGPASYDEAEAAYKEALEPLAVGVFDATAAGAYNSQFSAMAAQPEGDASQKLRRLGRELRDLRGKTRLPIQAAAACFVRQDVERPDKVRCVISGPLDTPYEGGLFVFDVYFPPGYPNVPPLMVLDTTGEGRARFNPNLYADGKVCLSLLGTWHGGDEASKWNPSSSSLFQILLSIQGMIFVEDPYFNEPQVELMRGTREGSISSMKYNAELRLATLRWAVLGLIKHPPPGLEDVVKHHFRVLRGVLVSRAGKWLREAAAADPSGTIYQRLVDVMEDVAEQLAAL